MGVIKDITNGSSIKTNVDSSKDSVTRVFIVDEVFGNSEDKPYLAISQTGVKVADIHPSFPGMACQNITAVPFNDSPNQWKVTLQYAALTFPEVSTEEKNIFSISINATTTSIETNNNYLGVLVTTGTLTPDAKGNEQKPEGYIVGGVPAQNAIKVPQKPAMMSKMIATWTITISRKEDAFPFSAIREFIGKVNSDTLVFGTILSLQATKVFLSSVTASSADGGETYDVNYTFIYKGTGWKDTVVAINPKTGHPYAQVELVDNGVVENVQHYEEVAMNSQLNFTNATTLYEFGKAV